MSVKKNATTQEGTASSRRSSLNAQKSKPQPELPPYLKEATGAQFTPLTIVQEDSPAHQESPPTDERKGEMTIIMTRSSILAVFMGAALLSITSFVAGFITYSTYFTGAEETPTQETAISQPTVAPAAKTTAGNESEALSQDALAFAELFQTPEAQDLMSKTGTDTIREDLEGAAEQASQASENVSGATEDIKQTLDKSGAGKAEGPTIEKKQAGDTPKSEPDKKKPVSEKLAAAEATPTSEVKTTSDIKAKSEKAPQAGYYTINLGEAATEEQADSMKSEFEKMGVTTFVSQSVSRDGRPSYQLRQGKFATYDEARTVLVNLPKPYSVWGRVEKDQSVNTAKRG